MPTDSEVSQKSAGLKVLKYNHVSFDKKLLALFEFLIRDSRLQTPDLLYKIPRSNYGLEVLKMK